MKPALSIALASALIATAAIGASPAFAQEATVGGTNTRLVQTADLDLASESGRRTLDRRLALAARDVCGTASDADVEGKNAVRRCRGETLATAKARRDSIVAQRGAVIAVAASR